MKDYALFSNYELFYVSKILYFKLVFILVKYSFTRILSQNKEEYV